VALDTTSSDSLPAGDANNDNRINLADFGVLVRHFGSTSSSSDWTAARFANFNGYSEVDFDDFLLLADNFGRIGMEVSGSARTVSATTGVVWLDGTEAVPDALLGRDLGAVRGLTLEPPDGVGVVADGSVFDVDPYEMLTWSAPQGRRIAIALRNDEPVSGDGVLLQLQGLTPADAEQLLASVRVLDAQGRTFRPAVGVTLPSTSTLHPSFPNPFNPSTTIPFDVAGSVPVGVRLEVFDVRGQRVRILVDEGAMRPGHYRSTWDARDQGGADVASGGYFVRLTAGPTLATHRLLLVR